MTRVMTEEWLEIQDLPGYAVSTHGRVMNLATEQLKAISVNQQGISHCIFVKDGVQIRRSVALLVARTFLEEPPRHTFDTPINLDGNRQNNHVGNLAWRPRWFAVKYHMQLKQEVPFGFTGVVECLETGEVFEHIRDCAMHFGVLEKEVIIAAQNGAPVFPVWLRFRVVD